MVKQLLLSQANVDIENDVSSVSTMHLCLMLMLEWNLMGQLIGWWMGGWVWSVGVAGSYCMESMCQDYNNHNANGKLYCKRK